MWPPNAVRITDIVDKVMGYAPDADVDLLYRSYIYSGKLHAGQRRKSGEPYLIHPVAVADLLAELKLDVESIAVGLMHDTIEDTLATHDEITRMFGKGVADMVEGLSKISKIEFQSKEEQAAENFRKMIFAMTQDIRVILVKLCDRTHNMRTLEHMTGEKQRRIAQETLDIYAPIANRLGLQSIKAELEDLSFSYLQPEKYQDLVKQLAAGQERRDHHITDVLQVLRKTMERNKVQCQLSGRLKHYYSIHRKMMKSNVGLEHVHDLIAFRIMTGSVAECYQALGVVHAMFRPISERFKDYIAVPKSNGYQSLHTTVIGPGGDRIEIQIRTREMHEIADLGIAAHWRYKEGKLDVRKEDLAKFQRIRELYDLAKELRDPREFMESIKGELFVDEVYVFTPRGEVLEFPEGATPLDFAYAIHTEVGNHCVGAKVDGRIVPLKYQLKSGEACEILTSPTQKPSADWMNLVVTSRARSKIRATLRQQERDRGKELGKEILEREFKRYGLNLPRLVKEGEFQKLLGSKLRDRSMEDLYYAVSIGKQTVEKILAEFIPREKLEQQPEPQVVDKGAKERAEGAARKSSSPVRIRGEGDILVTFGKCCHPIHGDPVVGLITRGRGITVHQNNCPNVLNVDPERHMEVDWEEGHKSLRPVKIRVLCLNRQGLLASMSKTISTEGVNIAAAECRGTDDGAVNTFEILVPDRETLSRVMNALGRVKGVTSVERITF